MSRCVSGLALVAMLGALLSGLGLSSRQTALAEEPTYVITVTINRVTSIEDMEGPFGGDEDFYGVVSINGGELEKSDVVVDDPDITPNWEFSKDVDATATSIPIHIEIRESDGGFRGKDDHADIKPGPGKDLELMLDLTACDISGDVTGRCDVALTSQGTGDDATFVEFTIGVKEPTFAGDLRPLCTIDPIWPQPGDSVTIKLEPYNSDHVRTSAETLEIWVDHTPDSNNVVQPEVTKNASQQLTYTFDLGPNDDSFAYACRIESGGLTGWTGWRKVAVGESGIVNNAVPVSFTGPRSSRIDIVFVADRNAFASPHDLSFLDDGVASSIDMLWRHDVFLRNQDKFNVWVALDMGLSDDGSDGDCDLQANRPSWTDAVLNPCAKRDRHLLTASTDLIIGAVHELGHVPFGLSDEYQNTGGYWQSANAPNVYEDRQGCEADAPNVGHTANDCRPIHDNVDWWFDDTWYTSDSNVNDIMVEGTNTNDVWHELDIRRIEWLFNECSSARC